MRFFGTRGDGIHTIVRRNVRIGRRLSTATRAFVVVAATLTRERLAVADEPTVVTAIDCPRLGAEQKAALDARARVEFLVRQLSGTLVVVCRETAELTWHSFDHPPVRETVPLAAEPRATVEQILAALDPLLAGQSQPTTPATSTPGMDPQPALPTPTSIPVTPAPTPLPDSPPPLPTPVDTRSTAQARSHGIFVQAGALGELWSGALPGALGPRVSARFELPNRFAIDAGGTLLFGLTSPDDVSARLVRVHAGGEYAFDGARRFRAGIDVFVDSLHATASQNLGTADKSVGGMDVRLSYAWGSGPFGLVLGPTLNFHPGPVRVELGTRELFHIPAVSAGVVIEAAFGPL